MTSQEARLADETFAFANRSDAEAVSESLGRIAYVVAAACAGALLFVILAPGSQTISAYLSRNTSGYLNKFRYVWYPAAFCVPFLLAILVHARLSAHVHYRSARGSSTPPCSSSSSARRNGLLLRWLFLAQRRIAIDEARRKLARVH